MKIYFSHGKESGPRGSKILALAEIAKKYNFSVESIDYQGILDPDKRVEKLITILNKETEDFILVGSSMGGYVSLVASEKVKAQGVFLLAPALYIKDYKRQNYTDTQERLVIIHGKSDEVIPFENSINYARHVTCDMYLIAGDHRLNTSLDYICEIFDFYLKRFNA